MTIDNNGFYLSLCMIVKNEEKYLADCLESVKSIADEIIIVDTGSNDLTVEIAQKYNSKIYYYQWINDFSSARNFALSKCSGRWILYLDADERLSPKSFTELKKYILTDNKLGVFCNVISADYQRGSTNVMQYVRLFKNNPNIKFEGAVHEQIEGSLKREGYQFGFSGIEIEHIGYDVNGELLNQKAERNLEILLKDFSDKPNGYKAFHIGSTYVILGFIEKAIKYFLSAIDDENLEKNHKAHCFRYLAAFELNISKNYDKALFYANEGIKLNEKQPLLNIILSNIYLFKGDFELSAKYCHFAYKYNYLLKNEANQASFEIIVDESLIVQHIINVAVLTLNKNLFNDFYNKLADVKLDNKWENTLKLFNLTLNNKEIAYELMNDINLFLSDEHFESLLLALNHYNLIENKLNLLEKLKEKHNRHLGLLYLLAETYLSAGFDNNSLEVFEEYYLLDKKNPAVINNLIALNYKLNKMSKLLELIDDAMVVFKPDEQITNKLMALRIKLLTILK
ncbi:MAG: glycosyltransferase [bacterium]